ncbi:MAG: bifunctional tetrahydrofolate synthase/dihydrofolate synthase, partial [Candidatus Competibacterales bacterium]|nr:bifunctional tetrahydrofolate synthase/dihydrofolate synthase [Candidatus Competibacterales bacterium]
LDAAGYRVGVYSSPHLLRYNERIRLAGREVEDTELCAAFDRVDGARGAVSLTYFEFGTLAALDLFRRHAVEVMVLEVGLGGRLDAVNAIDTDCAVVTGIALDHCDWLGPDRESIGREKAGIFRPGRPAICADHDPPRSLLAQAESVGARLLCVGRDYRHGWLDDGWYWQTADECLTSLPVPALAGAHQQANAAAALTVLHGLQERLPVPVEARRQGLVAARLPGRLQRQPGPVEWIFDVAHNPQAAGVLAAALQAWPCAGRTHLVLALLADKDAVGVARALAALAPHWYAAGIGGPRGRSGEALAGILAAAGIAGIMNAAEDVAGACAAAAGAARKGDRIVVCGSFHTVASALRGRRFEETDRG